MEHVNFNTNENGFLNEENIKSGICFNGQFYEFGTIEYKNLMLIEGKKADKDTLLGIVSEIETEKADNIVDLN